MSPLQKQLRNERLKDSLDSELVCGWVGWGGGGGGAAGEGGGEEGGWFQLTPPPFESNFYFNGFFLINLINLGYRIYP